MLGLMQDWPLLITRSSIMPRCNMPSARSSRARSKDRSTAPTTPGARARAAGGAALERDGIQPGDRVATLAWNTWRHLEAWYGITGIGAVYHTLNPRLFPNRSPRSSTMPRIRVLCSI